MAKQIYFGWSSVSRRTKKVYFGVTNIAQKVYKGYIGVNNVARLFFPSPDIEPVIRSYMPKLSMARGQMAVAVTGEYAIFAGGSVSNSAGGTNVVDAISSSLVAYVPTPLQLNVFRPGGASTGNNDYAIIAGGSTGSVSMSDAVEAYNAGLVKYTIGGLRQRKRSMSVTSFGGYAMFAGGLIEPENSTSTVDVYSNSLVRTALQDLSTARNAGSGVVAGAYALFGGGMTSYVNTNVVDAYNSSLVRLTVTPLAATGYFIGTSKLGSYGVFAGGTGDRISTIDIYNASLVRSNQYLYTPRSGVSGTNTTNYALFAGGRDQNNNATKLVEVLNANTLAHTTTINLGDERNNMGAATLGKYAIFAGGDTSDSTDVYAYIENT